MKLFNKLLSIFSLLLLFFSTSSQAETKNERFLVNRAIEAINICYHYAEEIGDQSKERNEKLARGIDNDCPKAKEIAKRAFSKYPNNTRLYEPILNLSDIGWYQLSSDEKNKLCDPSPENATCQAR